MYGVKQPGCGINQAPSSKHQRVKERVKLYLYSLSVPLWQVIGWSSSLIDRIKGMYCTWLQYLHYYICVFNFLIYQDEVKQFIPPILHIAVMSKSSWQWMCNVFLIYKVSLWPACENGTWSWVGKHLYLMTEGSFQIHFREIACGNAHPFKGYTRRLLL
jgi:hypothetical protein